VCSGARQHTRYLYASLPDGAQLERCHGVAAPGESVHVDGVPPDGTLLARQLVGVTKIQKGAATPATDAAAIARASSSASLTSAVITTPLLSLSLSS